jgi:hypothetical protein
MNGRPDLHVTWCFAFHAAKSGLMEVGTGQVAMSKGAAAAGIEATDKECEMSDKCIFGIIVITVKQRSKAATE